MDDKRRQGSVCAPDRAKIDGVKEGRKLISEFSSKAGWQELPGKGKR